ncbi:hypothetical protein GCK72_007014 [Caenorhabditis remanei]|uniref:Uncharacterized protein n=1 Tax=Caenorhabditis remanei TaxID=31234 RepID=A0A6A5HK45_CAERE|nr:hypothetical protein GCK72_007014 [Caenorhabditis remanei]KAF1767056.1 hypothetical protein GCK72_007014 [Caenorhabditis remanei]
MMDPTVLKYSEHSKPSESATTEYFWNSNSDTEDSEDSEQSTSYSDIFMEDDTSSECSELSEIDIDDVICDFEGDESEQSLEEIRDEIDKDFERILKELDDFDAELLGIKEVLA